MKLLALFMLGALAYVAAVPEVEFPETQNEIQEFNFDVKHLENGMDRQNRNIVLNLLIKQLFNFIRYIINNGSSIFGIPSLDPLDLEHYHLKIPAELVNLDLEMKDIFVTGFGGFKVHKSTLTTRRELSFDVDISFPLLDIRAGNYALIGDLLTALPLYGDGSARFVIEDFRFQAKLYLKQSDDGKSILIERIENAAYQIPSFKSELTGVIGGGAIDDIVNAVTEEVIVDYVRRFEGFIANLASGFVIKFGNPILDKLDTWHYIAPFV